MGVVETIAGGLGAAQAIGGAVSGGKGSPDQVTTTNNDQTQNTAQNQTYSSQQQTRALPITQEEQMLRNASIQNYLEQQRQTQELAARMGQYDPNQQAALQLQSQILGGQAYNLTPQETQQLNDLRAALIAQGTTGVNQMLQQQQGQLMQSAGIRGLRGQALAELQGQALRGGAEQLGNIQNAANAQIAQLAMQLPQQRVASQQGVMQNAISQADLIRQQALANQQNLQNPLLMQQLLQERLAQTTTSNTGKQSNVSNTQTTGTTQGVTPGKAGSPWDALTGAVGGFSGGVSSVADIAGAFDKLGQYSKPSKPTTPTQTGYMPDDNYYENLRSAVTTDPNSKPIWER